MVKEGDKGCEEWTALSVAALNKRAKKCEPICVRCGKCVKDKHTGKYGYYIHRGCEKRDKTPHVFHEHCPFGKNGEMRAKQYIIWEVDGNEVNRKRLGEWMIDSDGNIKGRFFEDWG